MPCKKTSVNNFYWINFSSFSTNWKMENCTSWRFKSKWSWHFVTRDIVLFQIGVCAKSLVKSSRLADSNIYIYISYLRLSAYSDVVTMNRGIEKRKWFVPNTCSSGRRWQTKKRRHFTKRRLRGPLKKNTFMKMKKSLGTHVFWFF